MKAILVIDEMPNSCKECPLWLEECYICPHMDDPLEEGRHEDCHLKPMPVRSVWETDFSDGWNACIEEILNDSN